jgi:hypothetical protein
MTSSPPTSPRRRSALIRSHGRYDSQPQPVEDDFRLAASGREGSADRDIGIKIGAKVVSRAG